MSRCINGPEDRLPAGRDGGAEIERDGGGSATDQRSLIQRRQVDDLARAARAIRRLLAQKDHGAGDKGNKATALAALVKALDTLHALEDERIGSGPSRRRAVILLPVAALTMDDWQASARAALGGRGPAADPERVPTSYRATEDE